MGHDEEDGPLRPTYNHERPPWIGLYSNREYKKQPEWWAEPGLKNKYVRTQQFPISHPTIREESRDFYDPPVADGTSLSGPMGLDSTRTKNLAMKADQPGNLYEFQRKTMEGSLQYKQIAEKYNLSPEHPGLAVNPTMNNLSHTRMNLLGYGTILPNVWQKLGPRFFDKPLNEGAFEKAAAAAKYAAIFMIPYTLAEIRATQSVTVKNFTAGTYLQRYVKLTPFPIAVASTWAFAISATSAIRNKDDVTNHFIAGPILGAFIASVKGNIAWGIAAAGVTTILGVVWQYQRLFEHGLQGKALPEQSGGFHFGPHHWKMLTYGNYETPVADF